jgi:hypothetical protein
MRGSDFAPEGAAFVAVRSAVLALTGGKTLTIEVGAPAGDRVPVRGSRRPAAVAWISKDAVPPWPLRVADLKTAAGV